MTDEERLAKYQAAINQAPWDKPSKRYTYRDQQGQPVHYTFKFIYREPVEIGLETEEALETARDLYSKRRRFAQARPTTEEEREEGSGKLKWSLKDTDTVLYNLAGIEEAKSTGEAVVLVEGEKDAESLIDAGICGTTSCSGAKAWLDSYTETLRGANVVLIADNDKTGAEAGQKIARAIAAAVGSLREVKVLDLWPGAPKGADVTDALIDGGVTISELAKAIDEAAPMEIEPEEAPELPLDVEVSPEEASGEFRYMVEGWGNWFQYRPSGQSVKLNSGALANLITEEISNNPNEGIIWHSGAKDFYQYNPSNGAWRVVDEDLVWSFIARFIIDYSSSWALEIEQKIRQAHGLPKKVRIDVASLFSAQTDNKIVRDVASRIKAELGEDDPFAKPLVDDIEGAYIVHCANGMLLIFDDGEVMLDEFSPFYRSRYCSPIPYVENAKCPRFIGELLEPHVEPDDILVLQALLGLLLTGKNKMQKIVILDGAAGSGKSTWLQVAQGLVGRGNYDELRTHLLETRFEMSRLYNVSLACGSDVPGDFLQKEGAHKLKALTGGDVISAEMKGGNGNINFKGDKFVIMTSNERLICKLSSQQDGQAWERRIVKIPFEAKERASVDEFHQVLLDEEGPGILAYAVEGLKGSLNRPENRLGLNQRQVQRAKNFISESDSVGTFLRECMERIPREDLANMAKPSNGRIGVTSKELYERYLEYCADNGWYPWSVEVFGRRHPKVMSQEFGVHKSSHVAGENMTEVNGYAGYRIKDWNNPF